MRDVEGGGVRGGVEALDLNTGFSRPDTCRDGSATQTAARQAIQHLCHRGVCRNGLCWRGQVLREQGGRNTR